MFSSRTMSSATDNKITEMYTDAYTDEFKVRSLYNILHAYSPFLQLGVYPEDNQLAFLLTMCRMIDRSLELNDNNDDNNDDNNNDNNDDGDDDNNDVYADFEWNLKDLINDFSTVFNNAFNSTVIRSRLTVDERRRAFEDFLKNNRYI